MTSLCRNIMFCVVWLDNIHHRQAITTIFILNDLFSFVLDAIDIVSIVLCIHIFRNYSLEGSWIYNFPNLILMKMCFGVNGTIYVLASMNVLLFPWCEKNAKVNQCCHVIYHMYFDNHINMTKTMSKLNMYKKHHELLQIVDWLDITLLL